MILKTLSSFETEPVVWLKDPPKAHNRVNNEIVNDLSLIANAFNENFSSVCGSHTQIHTHAAYVHYTYFISRNMKWHDIYRINSA